MGFLNLKIVWTATKIKLSVCKLRVFMIVSVVMPAYNCEQYISRSIDSVLSQSFKDFEIVICDDFSTDSTLTVCLAYQKIDERVKVLKNSSNQGAAHSRNRCLAECTGDYIAFLDSDDIWHEDKLQRQISFMERHNSDFCFTSYKVIDENGRFSNTVDAKHNQIFFDYTDLLYKKVTVGCSTVMVARRLAADKLMPNIRTGQDYAFWLMLVGSGDVSMALLKEPLTNYNLRKGSISANKVLKAKRQWSILRHSVGLSFMQSILPFISYAYHATIGRK